MDDPPAPVPQGNNPINTPQNPYLASEASSLAPAGSGFAGQANIQAVTTQVVRGQAVGSVGGKEVEPAGVGLEQPGLKDVSGKEIELPKEVTAAGVSSQPTTVAIPQTVAQMGVKAVGDAVVPVAPPTPLPLTDDQIALGLKQSVTSSWRWLAEFCRRRLKQMHIGLKAIHGKLTRVQSA